MNNSIIVISDDEECEDLGDLCDHDLVTMLDSSDPLTTSDLLDQHFSSQKSILDVEINTSQQHYLTPVIDVSIQKKEIEEVEEEEEVEDLGDLEDYFSRKLSSQDDISDDGYGEEEEEEEEEELDLNHIQSYSEETSSSTITTTSITSITHSTNIIPPPDYGQLTKKELQASIARYGFKNLNSREAMIAILEKVRTSQVLSRPKTTRINNDTDKEQKIIQDIKAQEEIWKKILRYETIEVNELFPLLTNHCDKSSLKSVLDRFSALKKNQPKTRLSKKNASVSKGKRRHRS